MPLAPLLVGVSYRGLQQAKRVAPAKATAGQLWIVALAARLPLGKVRAAIANKHARQIWTMRARGEACGAERRAPVAPAKTADLYRVVR